MGTPRSIRKKREEARKLYLSGECETNAEIARRLKLKPHTVGKWRREEDWDGLRLKTDRRAAEMFVEKIASDRTTLNVRHYRLWELAVAKLAEILKSDARLDIRDLERFTAILERAQKGQRLAKGMGLPGETEEAIRAQEQAEHRRLIDIFVEAVKEQVPDEETRDRIRQVVLAGLPPEEDDGAREPEDALAH